MTFMAERYVAIYAVSRLHLSVSVSHFTRFTPISICHILDLSLLGLLTLTTDLFTLTRHLFIDVTGGQMKRILFPY